MRDAGIELEFLTGPLQGKHDPAGYGAALFAFFAAMAEAERDYIRDKTLEGHETARTKGKAIGGVKVTDVDDADVIVAWTPFTTTWLSAIAAPKFVPVSDPVAPGVRMTEGVPVIDGVTRLRTRKLIESVFASAVARM